jgi:hypothetical protein
MPSNGPDHAVAAHAYINLYRAIGAPAFEIEVDRCVTRYLSSRLEAASLVYGIVGQSTNVPSPQTPYRIQ